MKSGAHTGRLAEDFSVLRYREEPDNFLVFFFVLFP